MKIVIGVLLAAILLLGGGAWIYSAQQRASEDARGLAEFDRALGRLAAGVEHEPKIMLRRTIADTAAAVDEYSKMASARANAGRLTAARAAIQDLEWALKDWGAYRIWQGERLFSLFDDLGANELTRECAGGKLFFENEDVGSAYLRAFRRDLATARGEKSYLPFESFNLTAATRACGEAFTKEKAARAAARALQEKTAAAASAAVRAENEKKAAAHRAVFALHVDVECVDYAELEVSADGGTGYRVFVTEIYPAHLDAQSMIRIGSWKPANLRITVNGKSWPTAWVAPPPGTGGVRGANITIRVQDLAARR